MQIFNYFIFTLFWSHKNDKVLLKILYNTSVSYLHQLKGGFDNTLQTNFSCFNIFFIVSINSHSSCWWDDDWFWEALDFSTVAISKWIYYECWPWMLCDFYIQWLPKQIHTIDYTYTISIYSPIHLYSMYLKLRSCISAIYILWNFSNWAQRCSSYNMIYPILFCHQHLCTYFCSYFYIANIFSVQ